MTDVDRIAVIALFPAVPQNGAAAVLNTADLADTAGMLFRVAAVFQKQIVADRNASWEKEGNDRSTGCQRRKILFSSCEIPRISPSYSLRVVPPTSAYRCLRPPLARAAKACGQHRPDYD
jgi:hypothetical protein